jgi:alkylation response protein AidB-like acyl-CoA dehydrogenase
VTTTTAPSEDELTGRAAELAPLVREAAARQEEARRLDGTTVAALASAGVFRLRTPRRYGGLEASTRTLVRVGAELGQADGATAWTASVYWIPTWMACQFHEQAQDEVFATPDVRVCGTLSPTGRAEPVEGGVRVTGRWGFISGALHAQWQVLVAVRLGGPEGPEPVMALAPMDELEIVDDWHTSGLAATGSVTTAATGLFVPEHRVVPLGAALAGRPERAADGAAIYSTPLLPTASASSVGTVVGLARGAVAEFLRRLPDRRITYTDYSEQAAAPLTHHQVARARLLADEAEFHALRLADRVDAKAAAGQPFTLQERAEARADLGAVVRRAKEAVDLVASAAGGSSVYRDVPMQRFVRDVQAISLHALMNPDTNTELYGRVLCGLPPNTLYV